MSTPIATSVWDATYGKVYLGSSVGYHTIEITTAITDRMDLVSDLEMTVRTGDGRGRAYIEIRLSAQEMRELAALLQTAADRVEDLEKILQQMVEQNEVAA